MPELAWVLAPLMRCHSWMPAGCDLLWWASPCPGRRNFDLGNLGSCDSTLTSIRPSHYRLFCLTTTRTKTTRETHKAPNSLPCPWKMVPSWSTPRSLLLALMLMCAHRGHVSSSTMPWNSTQRWDGSDFFDNQLFDPDGFPVIDTFEVSFDVSLPPCPHPHPKVEPGLQWRMWRSWTGKPAHLALSFGFLRPEDLCNRPCPCSFHGNHTASWMVGWAQPSVSGSCRTAARIIRAW